MSSCSTGKVRYRDRLAALIVLATLRHRGKGQRRVYRCPSCNGWHHTSQGPDPLRKALT